MFKTDKIKSIRAVGGFQTYDLTVAKDASFIGNGVVLHNSSSKKPNFQNLPSRGSLSKLIRRQFCSEKGCIYIKNDYNAAEVRQWANVSQDKKLADTFRKGMVMRKKLFLETDSEKIDQLKKDIKGSGDVHRLNYSFFFGKPPEDVTDEERNAVKAVVFGVIYGKGSYTLAQDLKCTEREAEVLLTKLFTTYKAGGDWIKQTQADTKVSLTARSPIGRVRHLASYLHQSDVVKNSTERRMCNSVIQGFSSDLGYAGGRLLQQVVYKFFQEKGFPLDLYQNNTVHDSVEAVTKFEHLPISLYVVEHAFTTLVAQKCRKLFGINWLIESEMDSEIGCSIGHTSKLDWLKLPDQVRAELEWSTTELGYEYTDEEKKEILAKFDHNYKIITQLKKYEIKKYLDSLEEDPNTIFEWNVFQDKERFTKLVNALKF